MKLDLPLMTSERMYNNMAIKPKRKRRTASLATMRQNVSHIRKMISRLEQLPLTVPKENFTPVKVRRMGSRLIIDGVIYKPADLEKLIASGKKVNWQIPALGQLEEMLAKEEYRRDKMTGKRNKITALTELEQKQAIAGIKMITSKEEMEFNEWLNRGSDGYKKNLYYHKYGADTINRGDIRGFLQFIGVENMEELEAAMEKSR